MHLVQIQRVINTGKMVLPFEKKNSCFLSTILKAMVLVPTFRALQTLKMPATWLINFIKNPSALITSKDKEGRFLHLTQFKPIMPPFAQLPNI